MVTGGHDDETEGHRVSEGVRPRAVEDAFRRLAGRIALDLATEPDGRRAGLSVEVRPNGDVELGAAEGHRLCLFIERDQNRFWVAWAQDEPALPGERPKSHEGRLGGWRRVGEDELREFIRGWLARCVR